VGSWRKIGVEVEAQLAYPDEFAARVQNRDYDLLLTGQSLGYNLDTYSYWHSSQADGNGLNLSNYKSFAADSLIETIRKTFENENKEEFLKDLAKEIKEDVPAIFLYRPSYVFATDWKVENVELENLAYPSDRFLNITDWCIVCEE
jgi:ABC-type transport system substrate-binding protein